MFDTPESSLEDLRTAALVNFLQGDGSRLERLSTMPSTVTSESQEVTESSGIQVGYHVAGHHTDPTTIPSELGDEKPIDSDEADYGSSIDHSSASGSPKNSDPSEDVPPTPAADKLGGLGSHLEIASDLARLPPFNEPLDEHQAQRIMNMVENTRAEMDANLNDGPGRVLRHGSPFQVSVRPQTPRRLLEDEQANSIEDSQEPRPAADVPQVAGAEQVRGNNIENASKMRRICCFLWVRR